MQFLILIFALIFLSGCNQEGKSELIWKISNSSQSIYLQGVAHVGPEIYVNPSAKTLVLFNQAQNIIVESVYTGSRQELKETSVELTETNQLALKDFLDTLALDGLLTKQQYIDIQKSDVAHFDNAFAPVFAKKVALNKKYSSLFNDYRLGIDSTLADLAIANAKHLSGLEQTYNIRLTWHQTCDANKLFPEILQSYKTMLTDEHDARTMYDVHKYIAEGNLDSTRLSILALEKSLPHVRIHATCSYHPRTRQWAENWESVMKRAPNGLVLVGAYHVVQEPTLLTLLREKGYVVERLR